MRTLLIPLLALVSCASATRRPAAARDFEALPLCSRIKFVYASPRVSMDDVDKAFTTQAFSEAKQIWTASEIMARDTGGRCPAANFADLIAQPASCRSNEWAGPYVDAHAFAPYARMTADDFEAFRNCWR